MTASSTGNRPPPRSRNRQSTSNDRDNNNNSNNNSKKGSAGSNEQSNRSPKQRSTGGGNNFHSSNPNSSNISATSSNSLPSRTISQLRSAAIANTQQQCTLTCYIPPSRVGAVIGRRGATIVHIQREAMKKSWGHSGQVRVSVVSQGTTSNSLNGHNHKTSANESANVNDNGSATEEESNVPSGIDVKNTVGKGDESTDLAGEALWTPVIIRGDPCGTIAAAKLLLPLLATGPFPGGGSMDDTTNCNNGETDADDVPEMDDIVLEIPIHRSRHAAIIGKKGLTIAAISADFNVRIMVPHRNQEGNNSNSNSNSNSKSLSSPNNINIIQLEGDLENVERCLAKILTVVCGSNTNSAVGTSPSTTSSNNNNNVGGTASSTVSEKLMEQAESKTNGPPDKKTLSEDSKSIDSIENSKEHETKSTSPVPTVDANSIPKPTITSNSNTNSNKKEQKFSEQTISVPCQLSHLVPSLGRIRQIGKSTNTVIRRKKIESSSSGVNDCNDVEDSTTTQLIVSGRVEAVKKAVAQLGKMLTPQDTKSPSSPDFTSAGSTSNKDANDEDCHVEEAKEKDVNGQGNDRVDIPRQQKHSNEKKPSFSKRRNQSGRGGGNRNLKKSSAGRGGGNTSGNDSSVSQNKKEQGK